MALRLKGSFSPVKFFQALLFGFLAVQIISWILSEFDIMPILKGGPMLLLFLVVIGIVSLLVLGKRLGQLDLKRDLPFIILVFAAVILLFIFLPTIVPQIFSVEGAQFGEFMKDVISAIMKLSPGGIYIGS